jgi:solute:Na+ symporter, SSS family
LSPSTVALTIICLIVAAGSLLGFLARFHHRMDLEQWTVAGRGFGLILVWLLMAGEIYTIFTFLGASGWAYSRGGPVLYGIGYVPLAYIVSFYILPPIWEVGQKYRLQTQADFFERRYGNKYLAGLVALIGVVCLIPYIQIQLTGLGIIAEVASFGAIHRTPAMVIGFTIVAAFVFVSGVRGVAWVSIVKDILLLFAVLIIGLAVPHIYFGGVGPMFRTLAQAKPHHLTMPGATTDLGHGWYITTLVLMALGFYMWPQWFGACFTARSGDTLRRNAVIMPLYAITMPLVVFVGFAAVLVLPGLKNADLSMLLMVRKTFPAWFLGIIGGAGALTAMIPAAIQLLTGATLYSKNLFKPFIAPKMSEQGVATVARIMVIVLTLGALVLAIYTSVSLMGLLLMAFAGVTQLFPGVVLGLFSKRVTTAAIFAGIVFGIVISIALMLTGRDPWHGMAAGFIGLCLNAVVTGIVTACTRVRMNGFEQPESPELQELPVALLSAPSSST